MYNKVIIVTQVLTSTTKFFGLAFSCMFVPYLALSIIRPATNKLKKIKKTVMQTLRIQRACLQYGEKGGEK